MSLWSRLTEFLSLTTIQPVQAREADESTIAGLVARIHGARAQPWRLPSIAEALAVPAIQRAVALISNTTGSLSMQGYRSGALMPEAPRVITRPDPYSTPQAFYRDSAYNACTRGEIVWWIAHRDIDGIADALIVVPLPELTVEDNPRNRLLPVYRWGTIRSTRYSAANPTGDFVHITYLKEPGALRGMGPLQLNGAAISVSVEAQEWAANFYADGGNPSTLIKHAGELGTSSSWAGDPEGEAGALRSQWTSVPNNVPRIIDQNIEKVEYMQPNAQGAQMLDARQYQNGEVARMYGIPGSLLEYNQTGSSLTYQNVEQEYIKFVRTCLAPNYLEPMEQALSDLLPRTTVARFYVDGLLRADIKTRFDVYESGVVKSGVLTLEEARRMEGLDPGNVEVAPVPFSPPSAVPSSLPEVRERSGELRCDGTRSRYFASLGHTKVVPCNAKLAEAGSVFTGKCWRCGKRYTAAVA